MAKTMTMNQEKKCDAQKNLILILDIILSFNVNNICVLQLKKESPKMKKWILNLKSEVNKLTGKNNNHEQQQNNITNALN